MLSVWELRDIREVYFGTLVLTLHCYSGNKKQNTDLFQITCFKEGKNMVVEKNLKVPIKFYKKLCLLVITRNKKHLPKRVVSITGENVLCSCYFWRFQSFLFRVLMCFGLWESSLVFQGREDQITTVCKK